MITDILKQLEGELVENRNYFTYEVPHIIDGIWKSSKSNLEFIRFLKIIGFKYSITQFTIICHELEKGKNFAKVVQEHQSEHFNSLN